MRHALLLVMMLLASALSWGADVYPSKPVRWIVALAPGGTSDLVARVISQQLAEQLGKPFIVDNRPGAGGIIGREVVAKSAPDGYTLSMADVGFAISPGFNKSLPYDSIKDFTPITLILRVPNVLVVGPSLGVTTLKGFIALAQASPGKFNYGSSGTGGANHLQSELFKIATSTNITHIPYKGGGAEVTAALIGGQIQMLITAIPTVLSFVKNGQLRALAVTTDGKRSPSMPDVPAMSEAGVSGMTIYAWYGLLGPAGLSKDLVNKLRSEVAKAIAVPSVRERFVAQDAELIGSDPEELARLIRSELERWAKVIVSARITLE